MVVVLVVMVAEVVVVVVVVREDGSDCNSDYFGGSYNNAGLS